MTPQQLARHQVWILLAALVVGAAAGAIHPAWAAALEAVVWPALALLLYVTCRAGSHPDCP